MATRTPTEIEADLAAARDRLSGNIAALVGEVHPRLVVQRTIQTGKSDILAGLADSKQAVLGALDEAKSWLADGARLVVAEARARFVDERGPRWDRLAAAGVALAATVGLVALATHRKH